MRREGSTDGWRIERGELPPFAVSVGQLVLYSGSDYFGKLNDNVPILFY